MLDHDGVVLGRLRKRPIGEVARRDLPEHIPTLAELYEQCGTGFALARPEGRGVRPDGDRCDTTPHRRCSSGCGSPPRPASTPAAAATRVHALVDSTRLHRSRKAPSGRRHCAGGIDAINLHHSDWNGGLVALFHRFERFAPRVGSAARPRTRPGLRMGLDGVQRLPTGCSTPTA
ncbi:MAG: hypothetical protein R2713_17615 [Ilumatobacteraceae bacterium]